MVLNPEIVRASEQRKNERIPSLGAVLILAIIIGLGACLGFVVPSVLWAQQTNQQEGAIVVSGKVTENHGTALQINHGKTYPFHPQVKLIDGEGHGVELEAKDLDPGFNVKVRVTEGLIDHIVVLFPQ
ncbi:MAG: hypothetical protein CAF43_012395 [Nitrospira sp. CG24C]|jgi:hypothetical protein|nr:MAG: hypothetical protein CAF43_012395 [Nitrospira sp. CG24C]TKB55236.1 MAG: hypothetical protein E8D50_03375 [Nitrospira sp.]